MSERLTDLQWQWLERLSKSPLYNRDMTMTEKRSLDRLWRRHLVAQLLWMSPEVPCVWVVTYAGERLLQMRRERQG